MSEYLKSDANKELIGKRGMINRVNDYASFLWDAKGTISEAHGNLLLVFDKPMKRHEDDNMPMNSVYLTRDALRVEGKAKLKDTAYKDYCADLNKRYSGSRVIPKTMLEFADLLKELQGQDFEIGYVYDYRIFLKYDDKLSKIKSKEAGCNVVGFDVETKYVDFVDERTGAIVGVSSGGERVTIVEYSHENSYGGN